MPATPKTVKKVAKKRVTPLRKSITPGTVMVLVSGPYRVFLKALESGLLLVTGPFKYNGVPLRRVNQRYAMSTSTKIDISSVKLDAKLNDKYFETAVEKKGEEKVATSIVADQKAVDSALEPIIAKVPQLKQYLSARFTLKSGDFPHNLKL